MFVENVCWNSENKSILAKEVKETLIRDTAFVETFSFYSLSSLPPILNAILFIFICVLHLQIQSFQFGVFQMFIPLFDNCKNLKKKKVKSLKTLHSYLFLFFLMYSIVPVRILMYLLFW